MATELIVAVDVKEYDPAVEIVDSLAGTVKYFKVGPILFIKYGAKLVEHILSKGCKVFLDMKFHDIPNTVKGAAYAAANLGVSMFTIHLSGGSEMIRAALDGVADWGAKNPGKPLPLTLGVTVLTSTDEATLRGDMRVPLSPAEMVSHLAGVGYAAGARGFVASPHEIAALKKAYPDSKLVIPGVRPEWADAGDQKRVMTPREAANLGADYVVVGRPIYEADDLVGAAKKVIEELGYDG